MEDLIKRSDAIRHFKAKAEHYRKRLARIEAQGDAIGYDPTEQINGFKDEIAIYESFVKELEDIPSAEPWDLYNPDEWCTDCKEYDIENHRCPRWNKVIRRTLEENKVVNCCGCVHWVNDVAVPDRMICKKLKIRTEDFFFCGWGEREGADDDAD